MAAVTSASTYGRMDLLGTPASPLLVGYSVGGLCFRRLAFQSQCRRARASEKLHASGSRPVDWRPPAARFELFDTGVPSAISVSGGITPPYYAVTAFDLRAEGSDPMLSTPLTRRILIAAGLTWLTSRRPTSPSRNGVTSPLLKS